MGSGQRVRESRIERAFVRMVEGLGGDCLKWVSPGRRGYPDRICLFDKEFMAFAELKAPDGRLTVLQSRRIVSLQKRGYRVFVPSSLEAVEVAGKALKRELKRRGIKTPSEKEC